jgi:vacuolar-type H+-ATPase subunit I/STV1
MTYLWIPLLILTSLIGSYCAKLSNTGVKYGSLYVFLCSLFGVLSWIWVTKVSKNLVFDSILYDSIMVVTFTLGFVLLKCGTTEFGMINWAGLGLAVIGLIMMKL